MDVNEQETLKTIKPFIPQQPPCGIKPEGSFTRFLKWLLQGHTGDVWIRSKDCPPTTTTIVMPHAQIIKDLFEIDEIPLAVGGKLVIPVSKTIEFHINIADKPSGFVGKFVKRSGKAKGKKKK